MDEYTEIFQKYGFDWFGEEMKNKDSILKQLAVEIPEIESRVESEKRTLAKSYLCFLSRVGMDSLCIQNVKEYKQKNKQMKSLQNIPDAVLEKIEFGYQRTAEGPMFAAMYNQTTDIRHFERIFGSKAEEVIKELWEQVAENEKIKSMFEKKLKERVIEEKLEELLAGDLYAIVEEERINKMTEELKQINLRKINEVR